MKENNYTVSWTINITAKNPREAAQFAWAILQDKSSTATFLDVIEENDTSNTKIEVTFDMSLESNKPTWE